MSARARALHESLGAWYARERRDLPWRRTKGAYAVWLSEIMLQQTRVETVIPYFRRFVERFPDVHALAEAPLDDVLALWSGLGYYRRARMLHAAAQQVAARGGAFPDEVEGLRAIAGIGAYTAGAVASIAFGRRAALVDGNVARVLSRIFAVEDDVKSGAGLAKIWRIADALVAALEPDGDAGDWNQALMELGATVCAPRDPRCLLCPARELCDARVRGIAAELPRLAPKKKPVPVRRAALVGTWRGRVLLARRRADGIFGGMWEPPQVALDVGAAPEAARAALEALVGAKLGSVETRGAVTHVLSHRRMQVDVLATRWSARPALVSPAGGEYDAFELVELSALGARGTTTLARKILAAG